MAADSVPGNPGKLRDLSRRLGGGWDTLRDLGGAIDLFQTAEGWDSEAAIEFRGKARGLRKQIGHAEYRFWAVSQALSPYARELDEAQRLAGPAERAMEQARGDLSRSTSRHEQLKANGPGGEAIADSRRSVEAAQSALTAAEKRIGEAIGMVEQAAGRFVAATDQAMNDPLADDDGWLAQQKRNLRRTGNWLADNPWVAPLIGVTSIPLGAFTFALGLASDEEGREFLEAASNWLNIASGALAFIPPAWPVALLVGVLGLAADGALYAHGRKDEGDLGWDVVGLATAGIGKVVKGSVGAVRGGRHELGSAQRQLRLVETHGRSVARRANRTTNWAMDRAEEWRARGNQHLVREYYEVAGRYTRRAGDVLDGIPRFHAGRRVAEAGEAVVRANRQLAATVVNAGVEAAVTGKQAAEGIIGEYQRFTSPVIGVGQRPGVRQPVPNTA